MHLVAQASCLYMDEIMKWCVVLLIAAIAVGVFLSEMWWHYTPAQKRMDSDVYYLLLIGKAVEHKENNDFGAAEAALDRAINLHPDRYEAYLQLGCVSEQRGNSRQALSNYLSALAICGHAPTNLISIELQWVERERILNKVRRLTNSGEVSN